MARARRAKLRRRWIVLPALLSLLAVAALAGWQLQSPSRATPNRSPEAAVSTAPADLTATSPASTGVSATSRLRDCRARVAAADRTLAAARAGIGHWAEHVQAQTDADEGRSTVEQMNAVFAVTRRAGAQDVTRYREAVRDLDGAPGTCAAVPGAPGVEAAALSACRRRAAAQEPVLRTARPAMADWRRHLAAMARTSAQNNFDAEQVWAEAWRAAPPHINAYRRAVSRFEAPDC